MSTLNQLSKSYAFHIIYLKLKISNNKEVFKYLPSHKKLKTFYPRGRVFFRLLKLDQEKQLVHRCNVKQCNKPRHSAVNFCSNHSPKNQD